MALILSKEVNMEHIHWYPGHIAKAEKKLKEQINVVDVVIEVLDARIPLSSTYPDIEKLLKALLISVMELITYNIVLH